MEKEKDDLLNLCFGEVELVYKRKKNGKISDRPKIKSSMEAYKILVSIWNNEKLDLWEECKVLF